MREVSKLLDKKIGDTMLTIQDNTGKRLKKISTVIEDSSKNLEREKVQVAN